MKKKITIEKLNIEFAELKRIYSKVILFTKRNAKWYKNPNSKTRIEEDLGLYGMDNEQFLIDFAEEFNVNFKNLDYSEYLTSEWEVANPKYLMYLPIVIPYNLIKILLRIIIFPFNKNLSHEIKKNKLPFKNLKSKKDITLGDLVSSIVKSEFAERRNIRYEIKTA